MKKILIALLVCCNIYGANDYVSAVLQGRFGNQLFIIATAYAYSLDHNVGFYLPDLVQNQWWDIPVHGMRIFEGRINPTSLPTAPTPWYHPDFPVPPKDWHEGDFGYHEIPYQPHILLYGLFQSELYFKHHRDEICELFKVPEEIQKTLETNHPYLFQDELIVGVQIRDFRPEFPDGKCHPTHGRAYYKKALKQFPDDALFIVTSNNLDFAKECIQGLKERVIYLDTGDYLEEFYALSMCDSFVISNSSFGWWAAWLSSNPEKKVIAPKQWFSSPYDNEAMVQNLLPDTYQALSYTEDVVSESISSQSEYPEVCRHAANNDAFFLSFKQQPKYREVLEHVTYEQGLAYLDHIKQVYPNLLNHIESFRENDRFGMPETFDYGFHCGVLSPTTLRYMKVAGDITNLASTLDGKKVIEIGAGYGGQCKILSDLFDFKSYTIVELEGPALLTRKYLNLLNVPNVDVVSVKEFQPEESYDLVISNYAFSGVSKAGQLQYINSVLNRAKQGYLTCTFTTHYYGITSLPLDALLKALQKEGRVVRCYPESPRTFAGNVIITWHES